MKNTEQGIISVYDGEEYALFQFHITETGKPGEPLEVPCKHLVVPLCLEIKEKEYLVLSCDRCEYIKLQTLHSKLQTVKSNQGEEDLTTVFKSRRVKKMCKGEEGTLYAMIFGPDEVIELTCTAAEFTRKKAIHTGVPNPDGMCYVPKPRHLLVVSDHDAGKVLAVDVRNKTQSHSATTSEPISPTGLDEATSIRFPTGESVENREIVWTLGGPVEGKRICPRGLLYSEASDSVLVADGERSRVLILDPGTGSPLQTIKPPGIGMSVAFDLDLDQSGNQLFVTYREYPGYIDADSEETLPVYITKVVNPKPTEVSYNCFLSSAQFFSINYEMLKHFF